MNKTLSIPACCRLGLAILLFSFLITGCGETRYDGTTSKYTLGTNDGGETYSSRVDGDRYSSRQYDATAHYILGRNDGGNTYTIGQHSAATAQYNLKQGRGSRHASASSASHSQGTASRSKTYRTGSVYPKQHGASSPIAIEVTKILFDFDKSVIKKKFYPELNEWADFFLNNPAVTAEIYGHADSIGTSEYNLKLSKKRAQSVINYLTQKGVDANRLTGIGYGETQPEALNTTSQGRQKNRRVEVGL